MELLIIAFVLGLVLLVLILKKAGNDRKKTNEALSRLPEAEVRELSQTDLEVMQHYFNSGIAPTKKMKKSWGKVYTLNVDSIYITSNDRPRGSPYLTFTVTLDGHQVVVNIPKEIEDQFSNGQQFLNKTIEVTHNGVMTLLFEIQGVTGLKSLYQQRRVGSNDKRFATQAEQSSFLLSRWSNVANIVFLICIVPWVMPVIDELGIGAFLFVNVPLGGLILFFVWKGYKKRDEYIKSREVFQLSGELSYNEQEYRYQVGGELLKLPSSWLRHLETKGKKLGHVKMEAMLHTFDLLEDSHSIHRYQPISLKGQDLDLNINNLPVAQSWLFPLVVGLVVSITVFTTPVMTLFPDVINSSRYLFASSELSSDSGLFEPKQVSDGQAISTYGLAIPYIDPKNDCRYMGSDNCPESDVLFFVQDKETTLQQYPDFEQTKAAIVPAEMIDKSYQSLGLVSVLNHPIDRLSKEDFTYLLKVLNDPLVGNLPSAAAVKDLVETESAGGKALAEGLDQLSAEALKMVQGHLENDLLMIYRLGQKEGVLAKGYELTFFDGWRTAYGMRRQDLYVSTSQYKKLIDDLSAYPVTAPIEGVLNRYRNTNYRTTVTNEHYSVSSFVMAVFLSVVWLVAVLYCLYLFWLAWTRLRLR